MKTFVRNLAIILSTVLILGCQKPAGILLTVSMSEIEIPASGGSETVTVECSQEWSVDCDSPWLGFSRNGDQILISVPSNIASPGSASMGRSATIVVTSGVKTCEIKVVQSEEPTFFTVDGVSAPDVFPSSGGKLTVKVGYNTAYSVTIPEEAGWITAEQTKSELYTYLYFRIAENKGDGRSAELTFRSPAGNVSMLVSQAAFDVPLEIHNAAELTDFITNVNRLKPGATYKFANDIDLRGVKLPTFSKRDTLRNDLDGQGHSLLNWTTDSPLFLNSAATVKNVVVDRSCKLEWSGALAEERMFSFLVGDNFGLVKNCINYGSIKIKNTGAQKIFVAGLVARQVELPIGVVEDCQNAGSVYLEATASASCSAISGVVGRIGHSSCAGKTLVKNCSNSGNIEFMFNGAAKAMGKFGVGGVVGQTCTVAADVNKGIETPNHGVIDGCVNSANIKWTYTEGGSGAYPSMGGIAGIVEGEIRNCINTGNLSFAGNATVAVTDANIGGVAGYVTYNAYNCKNYGTISTTGAFAGGTQYAQSGGNSSYSCIGGVFGDAGPFLWAATPADCPVKVESCYNYADLVLTPIMASSGGPTFAIGGVVGFASAKMISCSNNGSLKLTANPKVLYLGGVAGATTATVENCSNLKDLTFDGMESSAASYEAVVFGGVVGIMLQSKCQILSNTNSGNLKIVRGIHTPGAWTYFGGVVGGYSGYYGHTMRDCVSTGDVVSDSELLCVLGGVAGCFNGNIYSCRVENATLSNGGTIPEAGRPVDIGGLVGYANSNEINSCKVSGVRVSSANSNSYMAAFLGAIEKCKSSCDKNELKDVTLVNASAGTPSIGVLIGRYRTANLAADGYYLNWTNGTIDSSLTAAWPMAGFLNGGVVNY